MMNTHRNAYLDGMRKAIKIAAETEQAARELGEQIPAAYVNKVIRRIEEAIRKEETLFKEV